MGIQDLFKTNTYKNQVTQLQEENEYLKSLLSPEMQAVNKLNDHLQMMRQNEEQLAASLSKLYESNKDQKKIAENLKADIAEREAKIQSLDSEILMQDFGLYQPRFDFANSTQYKDKLKECRNRQKAEIKAFNSQADSTQWTVNNSKAQGKKLVRQISRLLMRAYNSECDEIVRKVRTSNIQKSITAVYSMADTVNKQATVVGLQIPGHYQKLKEEEVRLAYEFQLAKEQEKEEIREAREQQREAKKLAQEIAAARKKLEKEKKQYLAAYKEVVGRLEDAPDEEKAALDEKKAELKGKLDDVDVAIKDVDYREANQKAGYVYIISNIGSFGEGVYKIGMTRRLDPMERVRELGDASVPFNFDVHALIFSDDAPKLEAALHREFASRKINIVNQRREFFRVSLEEIEKVVKENYEKTVEFDVVPDAMQFRTSEELRKKGIYEYRRSR